MSLRLLQDKIISAETVDNAAYNSESVDLGFIVGYAIYAVWTGSGATGSIKLQAKVHNDADWIDVASSSQSISGAGSYMWNVDGVHYRYVRIVVTESGGAPLVANAWISAKGL